MEDRHNFSFQTVNVTDSFQSSPISHVCFGITIVCHLVHLGIIICIRDLKFLYGFPITLSLLTNTFGFVILMISCSIRIRIQKDQIMAATWPEITTESLFLSAVSWNLIAILQAALLTKFTVFLPDRRSSNVVYPNTSFLQFLLKLFYFFLEVIFAIGFPLFLGLWRGLSKPLVKTSVPIYDVKYHEIECSLSQSKPPYEMFLSPILIIIISQSAGGILLLLILKSKHQMLHSLNNGIVEGTPISATRFNEAVTVPTDLLIDPEFSLIQVRCRMSVKLSLTYLLVWIVGAFALIFSAPSLWHLFTLVCALQSLFINISFIFTRPVLMTIHNCKHPGPSNSFNIRPSLNHIHFDR